MRIGSGELRGRKLFAPKGMETRPTSARLKKSLFDVLSPEIGGARVLDLFAGAGALGIEALSKGAATAVFVERARRAADAIRRNLETLDLESRSSVMAMDVRVALGKLRGSAGSFDIVFADPPYRSSDLESVLASCGEAELLSPEGVVAVEHHHKLELSETHGALTRRRVLTSGESCFSLYRRVC